MLHTLSAFPDLMEKLPAVDAVRERLACALREVKLLRQLLKLAEHAARDCERASARKGAVPAR
jgi:hypothetical protein